MSIATDEHGVRIDALEDALRTHKPALFYVIPTHQNPSGATLPLDRREQLVALSQEHGFLVVADEVYHLLSYNAAPPPPLARYAAGGTVLSINSFSKILAPGLRLGWVQAAPDHIQRLVNSGLLDSGGGLNPFTSALVRVVLEEGLQDTYLAHLHETYRARIAALDNALRARARRPGALRDAAGRLLLLGAAARRVRRRRAACRTPHAMRSASAPASVSPAAAS